MSFIPYYLGYHEQPVSAQKWGLSDLKNWLTKRKREKRSPDEEWIWNASSSNLRKVSYRPVAQSLKVAFQSGGEYLYYGVPLDVYVGLYQAPSRGKYFHTFIRYDYDYERL